MRSSRQAPRTSCVSQAFTSTRVGVVLTDHSDLFLKNFVAANPAKSAYGFTLNRRRPGHFNLCFLANKNSTVQTWVCPRRLLCEIASLTIPLTARSCHT